MFAKLKNIPTMLKEMRELPEITLSIFGIQNAAITYKYFTKPHPRYIFIQNKKWGVALMPVPDNFDNFLKGKPKQAVRTNRSRCLKNGYLFERFQPKDSIIKDIMDIHYSSSDRQGRPMSNGYLDKKQVFEWMRDKQVLYGVFDQYNKLKAYAYVPVIGDLCNISRLLGHKESLNDGVMYLLISGVVNEMVKKKISSDYPKWIMYDTFFGAQKGLKYFKERLGFKPYKVIWKLG